MVLHHWVQGLVPPKWGRFWESLERGMELARGQELDVELGWDRGVHWKMETHGNGHSAGDSDILGE